LSIQFEYEVAHKPMIESKNFLFERKVDYINRDLDTAVLVVKSDPNKTLPDQFTNFGQVRDNLHLIGHPDGYILKDDTNLDVWHGNQNIIKKAKKWSVEQFGKDGYKGIEDKNRVLFHTSFAHGASGAPGMHIDDNSKASVVTCMLLRGYPDFCFTDELRPEQLNNISNDHKIEQGISMNHIWLDMNNNGLQALSSQIFGSCFSE